MGRGGVGHNPARDCDAVIRDVRRRTARERVRIVDLFKDFDRLQHGECSRFCFGVCLVSAVASLSCVFACLVVCLLCVVVCVVVRVRMRFFLSICVLRLFTCVCVPLWFLSTRMRKSRNTQFSLHPSTRPGCLSRKGFLLYNYKPTGGTSPCPHFPILFLKWRRDVHPGPAGEGHEDPGPCPF